MRIFLTASKDATLYQRYPTSNSGLDEILEVGKLARPEDLGIAYSGSAARTIIDFNIANSASFDSNAKYYLNLKIANATKLQLGQKLLINKISSSWTEGSGYFVQQTKNANDGATWRQASTSVSWSVYGAPYYFAPLIEYTLSEYPLQDLRIDVTDILQPTVTNSLPWRGLLVRFDNSSEVDSENEGNIKFFSRQTHTIHQPTLEIAWDDSIFVTGSLKTVPNTTDIAVLAKNPKENYVRGSKEKIRLIVRDKYPSKAFDATMRYKNKYYLPSTSYFSVMDIQAGTTVIAGDEFSKISCDATGSYFVLDTSMLYKNRYYTVTLTINNNDSDISILPELFTFKVI